ncbi:MAG: DUF3536 domain-containing protein [Nitrospiraceae bacterium]|nr:DUF3536 domain-containing protein [Nitrospiraceae bacterium]
MRRFLAIHAHFYQPPRENAWLEEIETQDSAYPYHDWNERINSECYAANAYSRILGAGDRIEQIVNNYEKISFDFGPTLLIWMKDHAPEIHEAVVRADKHSAAERSGHGNAIAHCYNHIIMPLANSRDKKTQIAWGIEDFKFRFGRNPEGMWLPETAVDTESLELMAEAGIRFTILAPSQAHRIRPAQKAKKANPRGKPGKVETGPEWTHVDQGSLDITRAYRVNLPSGKSIAVFFYNGPVSKAVAFEGLLTNGEAFAQRLISLFSADGNAPAQLVHMATDGESYGHHSRFGDMALSYCLHYIESRELASLTNYGEFLELFPPEWEAEIKEDTSWSCFHGVERWKADCGCNTGGQPQWNQMWRTPLRDALNNLRDALAPQFENLGKKYFEDPWRARNEYIKAVLDRSPQNVERFLKENSAKGKALLPEQKTAALKLMELQRHAMLMFTSCAWFFDDISGIETVQVLQYAGRVIQLARELFGLDLEGPFLETLSSAASNIQAQGSGRDIYLKYISPRMLDLTKVAVHYAISSLYEGYPEAQALYCFDATSKDYERVHAGQNDLALGTVNIRSRITWEELTRNFAVLKIGAHDINCGLCDCLKEGEFASLRTELKENFQKGLFSDALRALDRHAGGQLNSIRDLFTDEQRKIVSFTTNEFLRDFERSYRDLYQRTRFFMALLKELGAPTPEVFRTTAGFYLNSQLIKTVKENFADGNRAASLIQEMAGWGLRPAQVELEIALRTEASRRLGQLKDSPDAEPVRELVGLIEFILKLPFGVNLWEPQNIYYFTSKTIYRKMLAGTAENAVWLEEFRKLGEALFFNTKEVLGAGP